MFLVPILLLTLALGQTGQTPPAAWQQDLKNRRDSLVERNGPGTDPALRTQLLAMAEQDQAARGFQSGKPGRLQVATNLADVDRQLTVQLKQIVTEKGWPTIALVGLEASNAAMLLLTHTADHDWQRTLLPQLETLADKGRIDGSSLALVIDKELVARGQLQRYGSQFKLVNGEMAMFAVEDPANLDRRRAEVLLPPMDVYRETLSSIYHFKVSSQIVMATPPPPPPAQ